MSSSRWMFSMQSALSACPNGKLKIGRCFAVKSLPLGYQRCGSQRETKLRLRASLIQPGRRL